MEERKMIRRMSVIGIFGNVVLAAFKLLAGLLGRSGAMVSDAVHSLSDVFATLVAWIGVRLSRRQEDREHPYGHERLECVASLVLGVILAGTGLGIGYAGVISLLPGGEPPAVPTVLPLIAAAVSIAVKEAMFHYTMFYAKKMDSQAFRADAWHHRSDALSSVGSLAGILLARLGLPFMDPVAALVICVLILHVAYGIIRDAFARMVDTSCGADTESSLRAFIEKQPGVEQVDLLHTRLFGSKIYVDLEISVRRDISLVDAHAIAESVHTALEENFPKIKHVMIHVNPAEEAPHAISE